jgi:glucose/arabinose dehydrogenase
MLDLHGKLSTDNEQGLLGLAFHPKFATNGKLYVDFTSPDGNTHVVEYRVFANDPDRVDPSTARELVEIDKLYPNHNGGNLIFGADGKLYLGTGDGGAGGDPHKNGQNPNALLAKMLRFEVDDPHTPPPQMVYLGLRNPWRWSFDRPTGDLYIGDVGQDLWESVYVVGGDDHRPHNFGWNVVEGNHCYALPSGETTCDRSKFTPPAVDYPHTDGCSITGGVVYRGKLLPQLVGRYFYADYCTGLLRSFKWTRDPAAASAPLGGPTGWVRDHWDWKAAIDRDGVLEQISSFGQDADGELYIVLLTGSILQLVPKA